MAGLRSPHIILKAPSAGCEQESGCYREGMGQSERPGSTNLPCRKEVAVRTQHSPRRPERGDMGGAPGSGVCLSCLLWDNPGACPFLGNDRSREEQPPSLPGVAGGRCTVSLARQRGMHGAGWGVVSGSSR